MCPRAVSPTLISRLYFRLLSNYVTDIHLDITEIPLTPHIPNGSSSLPALPPNLLLFLAPFSFFSPRLPLPTQLPQAVSVNPSPYLICPRASGHHILVGCPRNLRNRPPLSSPKAAGPAQATESLLTGAVFLVLPDLFLHHNPDSLGKPPASPSMSPYSFTEPG